MAPAGCAGSHRLVGPRSCAPFTGAHAAGAPAAARRERGAGGRRRRGSIWRATSEAACLRVRDTAAGTAQAALVADAAGAAGRAGQPPGVACERRGVRRGRRRDLEQHLVGGHLQAARPDAVEARLGLGADPEGIPGVQLPVLRARRQPVRLLADRGRPPRGSGAAPGDAAGAPGRAAPMAWRPAGAGRRGGHGDRSVGWAAGVGRGAFAGGQRLARRR